jgi:hypothetical protein
MNRYVWKYFLISILLIKYLSDLWNLEHSAETLISNESRKGRFRLELVSVASNERGVEIG